MSRIRNPDNGGLLVGTVRYMTSKNVDPLMISYACNDVLRVMSDEVCDRRGEIASKIGSGSFGVVSRLGSQALDDTPVTFVTPPSSPRGSSPLLMKSGSIEDVDVEVSKTDDGWLVEVINDIVMETVASEVLQSLDQYTPCFSRVRSAGICGASSIAIMEESGGPGLLNFILASDPPLMKRRMDSMYAMIMHALLLANDSFSFIHGDVHWGNVLVDDNTILPSKINGRDIMSYSGISVPFILDGETHEIIIQDTRYIPRLIDYGISSFKIDDALYMPQVYDYHSRSNKNRGDKNLLRASLIEELVDPTYSIETQYPSQYKRHYDQAMNVLTLSLIHTMEKNADQAALINPLLSNYHMFNRLMNRPYTPIDGQNMTDVNTQMNLVRDRLHERPHIRRMGTFSDKNDYIRSLLRPYQVYYNSTMSSFRGTRCYVIGNITSNSNILSLTSTPVRYRPTNPRVSTPVYGGSQDIKERSMRTLPNGVIYFHVTVNDKIIRFFRINESLVSKYDRTPTPDDNAISYTLYKDGEYIIIDGSGDTIALSDIGRLIPIPYTVVASNGRVNVDGKYIGIINMYRTGNIEERRS